MNRKFLMHSFKLYIKDHRATYIFILICAGVFALVQYLYNGPMEAFAYAALLCILIGGGLFALEFQRFYVAHRKLASSIGSVSLTLDSLPTARKTLDADYDKLVRNLYDDLSETVSEAEKSQQYISDYYALWIHQIKVPISAMYLLLGENQRSSVMGIELFKIEQYVNMALSYARMESASTDFVFKEYDIDGLVKQSVRKYAPLFIAKKISVDIQPTNIRTVTDEKWLGFVIEQILSNSLKYTKTGTISIYPAGDALVIEDTGIGIAPEDIKRIGEKGFTGYNGRGDKKSTGLGLYMSYEVLRRLSHSMDIESEVGKGTKAILHLDRAQNTLVD